MKSEVLFFWGPLHPTNISGKGKAGRLGEEQTGQSGDLPFTTDRAVRGSATHKAISELFDYKGTFIG